MDDLAFVRERLTGKTWLELKALAQRASVSPFTTWNFAHGRSKNPRFSLISALANELRKGDPA